MKAELRSLDGLRKEIEITWPFPPEIKTPIRRPLGQIGFDNGALDANINESIRIRTYRLDDVASYRHPFNGYAIYVEEWEPR